MSWITPVSSADISAQTLFYTVTVGYEGRLTIDFTNRSTTTPATVKLWVVPSGESVGDQHVKEFGTTLSIAGTRQAILSRFVSVPGGGKVYAQASNTNVSCQLTGDVISPDNTESALTTAIEAATTFTQSGTGAVARTVESKQRDIYNAKDYCAVDGVTNDAAQINQLITNVAAAGGGDIYVNGNLLHNTAITLISKVRLILTAGGKLTWGGGATPQITCAATGVLNESGIIGGRIVSGTASKVIETWSAFKCLFRDIVVESNSATNFVIDVGVNTSGGTNEYGNWNAAFNSFENISQVGVCGTMIRMKGNLSPLAVVTVNDFRNISAEGVSVRGIDEAKWCDTNTFSGEQYYSLIANNAVGRESNTDTPASATGVYHNTITGDLSVDAYGVFTGRVGWKLNACHDMTIAGSFFQDPVAEGGQYIIATGATGYDFTLCDASATTITRVTDRAMTISNGGKGSVNYERLVMKWVTNGAYIYTEFGGTGTSREFGFGVAGAAQWSVTINGHLAAASDNNFDIGVTSRRPRNISIAGNVTFGVVAVASLPTAASNTYARMFVSDSNVAAAGNFGNIVAAGGANKVPVWCDGTNWRIG